jgi:hypothetical protein
MSFGQSPEPTRISGGTAVDAALALNKQCKRLDVEFVGCRIAQHPGPFPHSQNQACREAEEREVWRQPFRLFENCSKENSRRRQQ